MMADALNTACALIFAVILCSCLASPSASKCTDDAYKYKGRNCCRCAIGMRVLKHCTEDYQYGTCEACEDNTYMNVSNAETSCDLCTSCSHINANQVVHKNCTSSEDATCRCKDDYFCPSSTGICTVCNPCTKCGPEGIKVACKDNSDTVCNEKNEGDSYVGVTIGIVVAVIFCVALAGIVFLYKKRQCGSRDISGQSRNEDQDEATSLIPDEVDLVPHYPDLARVIGWKDMRDIALRSRIPDTDIESCKLNHPGDAYEQTLQLLRIWNEQQGRGAGNKLTQILQDIKKKKKAQDITNLLLRSARNNSPV